MKKFAKRAAAFLLAAVLSLSLAGCYNENLTWSARKGDTELPIGAYIYYLSVAYNEAAAQIDTETRVLEGEVEDTPAAEWITDRAASYINQYFWMQDEMERLGLTMTDDDYTQAQQTTDSYWSLFGTSLEEFGIAKTSFDIAYSQYNTMYLKVFEALYGEGGEREISEDELRTHFTDTYMNYEYFTAPLTKTGEDGASEDMTDEEKAAVTEELEALQAQVESGELTVEEAAEDYAASIDSDSNYVQSVNSRDNMTASHLPEAFITSLESMREGAIQVFEASGYMVFLHRLPIADAVEEELSNEDNRLSLMIELRNEEFQDYVREAAASVEGATSPRCSNRRRRTEPPPHRRKAAIPRARPRNRAAHPMRNPPLRRAAQKNKPPLQDPPAARHVPHRKQFRGHRRPAGFLCTPYSAEPP